jgi:hypothetical protein
MSHRAVVLMMVYVRVKVNRFETMVLGQPARQLFGHLRLSRAIDFGAITGGKDSGLTDSTAKRLTQPCQRWANHVQRHGHALAHRNRRGRVVQPERDKINQDNPNRTMSAQKNSVTYEHRNGEYFALAITQKIG